MAFWKPINPQSKLSVVVVIFPKRFSLSDKAAFKTINERRSLARSDKTKKIFRRRKFYGIRLRSIVEKELQNHRVSKSYKIRVRCNAFATCQYFILFTADLDEIGVEDKCPG